MFHFLSRTVSLKFIFINSSKRNPFTFTPSSFLIVHSLGFFSQPPASTTSQNPYFVIDFFKSHGFSESKALAIVQSFPQLLRSKPNKSLQPKIDFFKSKGFSNSEIHKIITGYPKLLGRSLQREIIPNFEFFGNMFQSERMVMKTVTRNSGILCDFAKKSLPIIKLLRKGRVPESNVIKFIQYFPRLMKVTPKRFEESMLEVKQLGFDHLRSRFVIAVAVKLSLSKSTWARNEGIYRKWGWGDDDIVAAFRLYPFCMAISENKIEAIMDFVVNKLGFEACDVAKCPVVLSMSFEKRITPRGSVVLALLSKGLVKKMNLSVNAIFKSNEKLFLGKFVFRHEGEADELLKLYQVKLSSD